MTRNRRYVLAAVVTALGVVTAAFLLEVLGTILFALTVAYVLYPVHNWLMRRGLSANLAAIAATLCGFFATVAVFSPIFVTLYFRRGELIGLLETVPDEIPITAFDQTIVIDVAEVQAWTITQVQQLAVGVATATPELAIKFALFVILLFGLLLKGEEAGRAAIAPVPREYRDIVHALTDRTKETLYAIYVLQLGTSVATLIIAYPLFWGLGYESALVLAIFAAILQFVPIIGPSLLILPIALYHVAMGELVAALLVGVLGLALIAWFPDIVVRPRLAQSSAGLPGSLYFIGFTGGLFTMGAIGIVVGPLVVAVFVEAVSLLADEVNRSPTPTLADFNQSTTAVEQPADDSLEGSSPEATPEPDVSPSDDATPSTDGSHTEIE